MRAAVPIEVVALSLAIISAPAAFAQQADNPIEPPSLQAARLDRAPIMDGVVDSDDSWAGAGLASGRSSPTTGCPPHSVPRCMLVIQTQPCISV